MGLSVNVFRSGPTDFTNGGISARADRLVVVNIPGPSEPGDGVPAVMLVDGPLHTKRLVPAVRVGETGWMEGDPDGPTGRVGQMFGGNYASTGDGRWSAAVGFYGAVAIHDRYETPEHADAVSR
jgi:hypothetical protein